MHYMSPQQQDTDGSSRPRPRANTSFGAFPWRRSRPDASPLPATPAAPLETLPIETLVQALTPPAVPSLSHARSLVVALSTQTPSPSPAMLTPILSALCSTLSPPALQAAGFDILSSYCVCGSGAFTTSDGLAYFDLFRAATNVWTPEVWEPRFKALNALLSSSGDAVRADKPLLDLLTAWIAGAFEGLLVNPVLTLAERQERERAIETLSDFLTSWVGKIENAGRLTDEDVTSLFEFYAALVDRALRIPADALQYQSVPSTPLRETPSGINSPVRHRRHPSSTSGMTSPASVLPARPTAKHPAQLAAWIYLKHLETQLPRLPPSYLPALLPLLFRSLASFMSPLPVISLPLSPRSPITENLPQLTLEARVIKAISALLNGPYSTTCLILLKRHLLPTATAPHQTKTAVGAHRALRLHIRRVLEDRLAMFYIARNASSTATPAGAPGVMSIDAYVLERAQRAWRKEGNAAWDARKIGFLLSRAVRAWIAWPGEGHCEADLAGREKEMWKEKEAAVGMGMGREKVLEEVAGLLKDVLQEMDDRAEDDSEESYDDHASAVGEILHELMNYIRPLKYVSNNPYHLKLDSDWYTT